MPAVFLLQETGGTPPPPKPGGAEERDERLPQIFRRGKKAKESCEAPGSHPREAAAHASPRGAAGTPTRLCSTCVCVSASVPVPGAGDI